MNPTGIKDPAERLSDPAFVKQLRERYDATFTGESTPATLDDETYALVYGNFCDAAVQLLWPEKYNTGPDDRLRHTSAPARAIALVLMSAAGFREAGNDS